MFDEIIRQKLIKARNKAGLTQQELADKTGISYSVIAKIESGHRKADVETVGELAEFYSITTDWIYGIGKENNNDEKKPDKIKI